MYLARWNVTTSIIYIFKKKGPKGKKTLRFYISVTRIVKPILKTRNTIGSKL